MKIFILLFYFFFFSDLDECASESPACDINAACLNTVGSFSCACNAGYIGDGMNCRGIQILDHGSMLQHRYSFEHETSARKKKTCVTLFIKHCFRSSSAWYPGLRRCFYLLYEIKVEPRVWILFRFFAAQIYLSLEGTNSLWDQGSSRRIHWAILLNSLQKLIGSNLLEFGRKDSLWDKGSSRRIHRAMLLDSLQKLIKAQSLSSSLSFFLFNPPFYIIQPHKHHLFNTMVLKMFSS